MKNLIIILTFLSVSNSVPVDRTEVELVEPINTNKKEEPSFFSHGSSPIFIIRGFPQGFPKFGSDIFQNNRYPSFFDSVFGPPRRSDEDKSTSNGDELDFFPSGENDRKSDEDGHQRPKCGFLCSIFADLDHHLKWINTNIKDGNSPFPQAIPPSKGNTTYTEKVLPDGSTLKVNRTTFADSDNDGNSYFFHQSTHVINNSDHQEEDDKKSDDEKVANDQGFKEEEIGFKLPEGFDPNANEVSEGYRRYKRETNYPTNSGNENEDSLPSYGDSHLIPIGDDDIKVNKLLLESAKRGSLIQIEPDSELIEQTEDGKVVPLFEQFEENPWDQQESGDFVFPRN